MLQINTVATLEIAFHGHFYLSNLYERNESSTNIGTIDEFMMRNQRTYVVNQDNKHRLEDFRNDFSLNTSRDGVGEAAKCSESKPKSTCKYGGAHRDREP